MRPDERRLIASGIPSYLRAFIDLGALRFEEAVVIYERWERTPGDVWSHALLAEIPAWVRQLIDAHRGQTCEPVPFDEQEG